MKCSITFFTIILFTFLACTNQNTGEQEDTQTTANAPAPKVVKPSSPDLELKTYQNENNTWGYDIWLNGKRYIHQPDKPAVGGRQGFEREAQALSVGELMIEKIKQGIMPPSVSAAEVDSLQKLY